jgi:hypothetical protein
VSDSYAQVQTETRTLWWDWLTGKHATSPGIWLVTWKKTSRGPAPG